MDYHKLLFPTFPAWDLRNKNVVVRIDGNVPVHNNYITDDFRLLSTLPTLSFLKERKARIILITHHGRPDGFNAALSNHLLASWFEKQGFSVFFDSSLLIPSYESVARIKEDIYMVENIRFFTGERGDDPFFSQQLAAAADFYINDAWGTVHRAHASLTRLPSLFDKQKRSIGFLIEKELKGLEPLRSPVMPCVAVVGGSKVESKGKALLSLIENNRVTTIALCPPLAIPFLAFQGSIPTHIDPKVNELVQEIRKKAQEKGIVLLYPCDFFIKRKGHFMLCSFSALSAYDEIITIGPDTVELYGSYLHHAQTILISGLMGFLEYPMTLKPLYELLKVLENSTAYRVAAGGDMVSAVRTAGYKDRFDFLSTGGGSTLSYIAGLPLPGLSALE